ncbi:MAG: hypothetical protein GOVbin3107_45 [Prokaryotic dsDNA virus sp.]|nr:MAG: hypothetical protein GOVbin3107_45 [Prokaryotic dsDNA virus sp.]
MNKQNLINDIKNQATKLFNQNVTRLHYSENRLNALELDQLINLLVWFKKENDKILTIKNDK